MPELPIEISPADTKALLDKADAAVRLIDCREEDEWRICRIEGATLIPLSHFAEEASSKLQNTDQHLIFYCHHGMRSLRATHWLRQKGFASTQSMAGGIEAWSDSVDPTTPRY
jgi:rhodanese-related sulfurtransferase